jgi:hypothetical protein
MRSSPDSQFAAEVAACRSGMERCWASVEQIQAEELHLREGPVVLTDQLDQVGLINLIQLVEGFAQLGQRGLEDRECLDNAAAHGMNLRVSTDNSGAGFPSLQGI